MTRNSNSHRSVRRANLTCESLERRELMAADFVGGVLPATPATHSERAADHLSYKTIDTSELRFVADVEEVDRAIAEPHIEPLGRSVEATDTVFQGYCGIENVTRQSSWTGLQT